jgi:hypothetical protein
MATIERVRLAVLVGVLGAAGATPRGALAGEATLYTTSGELIRSFEVSFDPRAGFSVSVPGQARRTLAAEDVVFVDFGKEEGLDPTGAIVLALRNGDSLRGAVEDGNENDIALRAPFGAVRLSINAIDRLFVASNLPRNEPDDAFVPIDRKDTVYKKTAKGTDVVTGTLEAFTRDGLILELQGLGKYPFKFLDVVALALVPQGKAPEPAPGAALVSLRDGSRLTGSVLSIGGGFLEMEWVHAKRVRIPQKHVASMTLTGRRHLFLSDLEPSKVTQIPPFGGDEEVLFPWRRDKSVGGSPLQVGGLRFAKGIGMHARTELGYALDGSFATFTGLAGIDDETKGFTVRGSAVFRVLVDGEKRFESRIVAGGPAERIPPVDVRGAKELTLVVDFADEVGAGARGDWGNALLTRP